MRKRKVNGNFYAHVDFYNYVPYTYNGIKGTVFYCIRIDREFLQQFNNIAFLTAKSQYAPEQKKQLVFVGSKCF